MPETGYPLDPIVRLQAAEVRLTSEVIDNAEVAKLDPAWPPEERAHPVGDPDEEDFFLAIGQSLDEMCEAIAAAVDADTCVCFLVTQDTNAGEVPCMVMRGACGNFRNTLEEGRKHADPPPPGYVYVSRVHQLGADLSPQDKEKRTADWPVTNQIWHLGDGRLANSNRGMDILARAHKKRMGQGDNKNYQNRGTLRSVFRNMVAIPIFARGGSPRVKEAGDEEAPSHREQAEFLSRYRVIGILKVENKRPQRQGKALPEQTELIQQCPPDSRQRLEAWFGKRNRQGKPNTVTDLLGLFRKDKEDPGGFDLLNRPPPEGARPAAGTAGTSSVEDKKREGWGPDAALLDYLTEAFDAQFTKADVELLVSLAMQLGRILARRTIEHAARHNIVISEHEVGTLNVHYRDVRHFEAYRSACDCLRARVVAFFQELHTDLKHERQREIYHAQVSHRIGPREPIREVTSRLKDPISLFRKLVGKQEALDRQPKSLHVILHELDLELKNFGPLTEHQVVVRGGVTHFMRNSPSGVQVRFQGRLGVKGGPQAVADRPPDGFLDATLKETPRPNHLDRSLVWRILHLYKIDDLAGIRVTCDYLSDLSHVLELLRAHAPEWNLRIARIDPAVDVAKEGGYRGIHLTLEADVRDFLPPEIVHPLSGALQVSGEEPLIVPCEVQLRTTLQDAEAQKSWGLTYKHEEEVEKALLEMLHILSNQLYEAERSADIIRDRIEEKLLPDDFGGRSLLNYLRPRLSHDGLSLVELGLRCAKRIHDRRGQPAGTAPSPGGRAGHVTERCDLCLSGLPYLSLLLATCQRLVYDFQVTDPDMLFLALIHDLWMNPCPEVKRRLLNAPHAPYNPEGFRQDLQEEIQLGSGDRRHDILRHLGGRLNLDRRLEEFPTWFWVLLGSFRRFWQDYHKDRPEDLGERRRERLRGIRTELKLELSRRGGGAKLDDWLQRAFVLEAAILLGQLEELPDEPNRQRAEEQFLNAYEELEVITSNLPPSPIKLKIIEETTRVFRETADRLGVEVPINWYR